MDRRKFLTHTPMAATSIAALAPLTKQSFPERTVSTSRFYATNWGYTGDLPSFCKAAAKEAYDGVEIWLPKEEDWKDLSKALEEQKLRRALLVGAWENDFSRHLEQYKSNLLAAVKLTPDFINCHAGKDYFTFEQNRQIVEFAIETSLQSSIPVYQETHRGRMFFAAHITQQFLEEIPDIRLTLDISHWCNVHESLLQDQEDAVALAINHSEHIHARIGHAEGPQITDLQAPEWRESVDAHLRWWDKIVERRGAAEQPLTITPEFGPPHYMPTVPYTGQPLADNWKVNVETMTMLRQRYG
ncbi:MAG: sugar phosphate isomerase/epimerase [Saprospiraceae bacterium]|nr:sugar phosphate isomerase/epimerase [Saprospiraceae bacterium]